MENQKRKKHVPRDQETNLSMFLTLLTPVVSLIWGQRPVNVKCTVWLPPSPPPNCSPPQAFNFTDFMLTDFTPSPSHRRPRAARWDDETWPTHARQQHIPPGHQTSSSSWLLKRKNLVPQHGWKLHHGLLDHRWGAVTLNVTSYLQEASQLKHKNTICHSYLPLAASWIFICMFVAA